MSHERHWTEEDISGNTCIGKSMINAAREYAQQFEEKAREEEEKAREEETEEKAEETDRLVIDEDIYTDRLDYEYRYEVSDHERMGIYQQIINLGITIKLNKTHITIYSNDSDDKTYIYPHSSLFGSNPPMSNIRYVIENEEYGLGITFDGTELDKECRHLHAHHIKMVRT